MWEKHEVGRNVYLYSLGIENWGLEVFYSVQTSDVLIHRVA